MTDFLAKFHQNLKNLHTLLVCLHGGKSPKNNLENSAIKEIHSFRTSFRHVPMRSYHPPMKYNIKPLAKLVTKSFTSFSIFLRDALEIPFCVMQDVM